ncbi:MAG: hypothetical protein HQ567_28745 [Candidatus Nealsonbacteria bacterium]|nr:hypothetical protein [Candidatus Nealsonbacteria bacterium]
MSLLRLPKLRPIASTIKTVRERFTRHGRRSAHNTANRRLRIDPLEERQLLSVSPMNVDDRMVTEGAGASQFTNPAASIAVDGDGDFVVVWTRFDDLVERDPLTGDAILDPDTGEPIPILDPTTGLPPVDPITGDPLSDANIYARYYTDEVQRITLPESVLENTGPGNVPFGTFSLAYGGPEVQKISLSATYEPFTFFQQTIGGTFTLGFDANGNGAIDEAAPGIPANVTVASAAADSSLIFSSDDPGTEGVQVVFEDSDSGTVVYDEVGKTLTFGITDGVTTAAAVMVWLATSPAGATFTAELASVNNGTGIVENTDLLNPPALADEGGAEASATVVFPGTDNDLVFRAAAPLPDLEGTVISFSGIGGLGAPLFTFGGPGSSLVVFYDSDGTTAQEIVDGLAADVGLAGTSFTVSLDPTDGIPGTGAGVVDAQISAAMSAAVPPVIAETTEPIPFDEVFFTPEENAEAIETALRDLDLTFGSGTTLLDVTVVPVNALEYEVHFADATMGQNQPQILATEFDFAGFFGGAFLPAVQTSTVDELFMIADIPVSPQNPFDTATAIEQWFWQNGQIEPIGPTKFYPPTGTPPNAPYNFGFDVFDGTVMRNVVPRVSVKPVATAEGDLRLLQFDLTFVGDDGPSSGDSGKMDHPPLAMWDVKDGTGTVTAWPSNPDELDPPPETVPLPGEEQLAKTLKEPSAEFRVNPPEPDSPFTLLPDLYDQTEPAVTMDSDGDFVIAWESEIPNSVSFGSFSDIFARRFSPTGIVESPEFVQGVRSLVTQPHDTLYRVDDYTFRVNNDTANPQFQPHVSTDDAGNFVIAWANGGQDLSFFNGVSARRFDLNGTPIDDEWQVSTESTTIHFEPYVDMSANGHFAIVWNGTDDPAYVADLAFISRGMAEVYSPEGVTLLDQFPVGGAGASSVAFDLDDNFVIAWDELAANDNPTAFAWSDILAKMYKLYEEETQVLRVAPIVPGTSIDGTFQLALPGGTTNSIFFQSSDETGVAGEIQRQLTLLGLQEVTVTLAASPPGEFAFEIRFRGTTRGVNEPDLVYVPGTLAAAATVTMATLQDGGIGDTNAPIRDTFRANSANFDPNAKTLWAFDQMFPQGVMDADGDLTVIYDGYGPDVSEDLNVASDFYLEVLSRPENADLLDYFMGFLVAGPAFADNSGDVDSVLEEVLINAAAQAAAQAGPAPTLDATLTVTGPVDFQTLQIDGAGVVPLSGEFILTVDGMETAPILFDDADLDGVADAIATELQWLDFSYFGTTVAVASTADPYEFTMDFSTALAPPFVPITAAPTPKPLDATISWTGTLNRQLLTFDGSMVDPLTGLVITPDPLTGEFWMIVDGQNTFPIMFDSADLDTVAADMQMQLEMLSVFYTGVVVTVESDVAPYEIMANFNDAISPPTTFIRGATATATVDVDSELGRLRAIMDEVATLMRGEANGVMYTQWDADPQLGPMAILSGDNIVNANRDGHNTRFMISLDYEHTHTGTFTVEVNGEAVTITPAWTDTDPPWIDIFGTADNINAALDAATSTGVNWPEYMPGVYEQPIDVRVVNVPTRFAPFFPSELELRADTGYAMPEFSPLIDVVYEVTFQGEVHDMLNTVYLANGGNNLFDNPVPEIQQISFTGAADMEGWFSLSVGSAKFDADSDVWMPDVSGMTRDDALAALSGVASAMEGGFASAGLLNTVVVYEVPDLPDPLPDPLPPGWPPPPEPPYTFTVYFEAAGVDQDNIAKTAPAGDHGGDPAADPPVLGEPTLTAGFDRVELEKGRTPQSPSPFFLPHTWGDEGTVQGLASVGMQPDGNFVVAWSESVSAFSSAGIPFNDDVQIFFRQFHENTDTAGPRMADLVGPDGTRTAEGGRYATTEGLQQLVITFDEELLAVPDVDTQLEYMGIDRADASENLLGELHRRFDDSVLNPLNYRLLRNDTLVSRAIVGVEFGMSIAAERAAEYGLSPIPSNKWEVILTFDANIDEPGLEPMPIGKYTIQVSHPIPLTTSHQGQTGVRDRAGNPLGHTGFQIGGEDFSRSFNVVIGEGPGNPGTPDANSTDDPINVSQFGRQDQPAISGNPSGDYVVVWVHGDVIIGQTDIMAQRFSSLGEPDGPEFIVNTYQLGNQIDPDVAMDDEGGFVVTWSGAGEFDDSGVFAQRYDSFGRSLGEQFRANDRADSVQDEPSVAVDADGDFIITWSDYDPDGDQGGIVGRRYNSAGGARGNEFHVNTTTQNWQDTSDVAMDDEGAFVVVWASDAQDGSSWGVFGQRFDAAGEKAGGEFLVNNYRIDKQLDPAVAMDADGDFIVTWSSFGQDGSGYGVYANRFNGAGVAQGEFRVNTETEHWQFDPDVAVDSDGNFVVTWTSFGQDDDPTANGILRDYGIFAHMYEEDGTEYLDDDGNVVGEFRVNAETDGDQFQAAVTRDAAGFYVVVWVGPDPLPDPNSPLPPPNATDIYSRQIDPPVETPAVSEVVGRHVFYNGSTFDTPSLGNRTATDDDAIAPDKTALMPGDSATFENYTSFSRGINGIMVDLASLPDGVTPTAGDFQFRFGNDDTPGDWGLVATSPAVAVRTGAGVNGSDRVTMVWPDGLMRNGWLQVTVRADNLGLADDDVFYFGNALAETGSSATGAQVTTVDLLSARNNPRSFPDRAAIDFPYDFDRDGAVNATDVLLARNNQTNFINAVRLIHPSAAEESPSESPFVAEMAWLAELQTERRSSQSTAEAEAVDAVLALLGI